jgi:hypothetical protein
LPKRDKKRAAESPASADGKRKAKKKKAKDDR